MLLYGEPGRGAARSGPIEHDPRDVAAQKAIMRSRISGMAWEASWLLDRMDDAPDFYFGSLPTPA